MHSLRNWLLAVVALGLIFSAYWYSQRQTIGAVQMSPTTRADFEPLVPFQLGTQAVYVSIASTTAARTRGLSRTTILPADIVKLFVFETPGNYTFWMKEMNYPIDMVWLDATGVIVHIEESVSPQSYPKTYGPPVPAQYVIETNAGFFATTGLTNGDRVQLPSID
jgi:uncharacterized protein